jgi:hypothetical protein
MKTLGVLGMTALMVLAVVAAAYAVSTMDLVVDTQGYTLLTQVIRTAFVLDAEMVEFTPFGTGTGEFDLMSTMVSVPTGGWPTPGGLYGLKQIDAVGGTTEFRECAVSGGYMGANGFISEYIYNEGEIHITKEIDNLGEWNLFERKWITGSGFTIIEKDLGTWGLSRGPDDWHPTDAQAYIEFASVPSVTGDIVTYFNTGEGGFYVPALPSHETALGWCQDGSMNEQIEYFVSTIFTDEPFTYFEEVGVDPYWPAIEPPDRPVFP